MKVNHLTLAIAGSAAFALCASIPLEAQGTTVPALAPAGAQKLVTAGAFKPLSPNVHFSTAPDGNGETMMTTVGHVTPPPPGPPPGGIPIDSLPHGEHGLNPGSLVFALQLKRGQKVPSTTGLWISDSKGRIVFRTSVGCSGCTARHGILNMGLNSRAAAAAAPFMTSGNTMHLVTTSRLTEANQIHASIGTRAE